MKVSFSDVCDFLNELEREKTKIVRVTAKEQPINNGTSEMYLRAGFLVGENLNELNQYCGETFQGNKSNEMRENYESLENEIREFCKAQGIEVRGGEYDG